MKKLVLAGCFSMCLGLSAGERASKHPFQGNPSAVFKALATATLFVGAYCILKEGVQNYERKPEQYKELLILITKIGSGAALCIVSFVQVRNQQAGGR